jgi:hypothetical protein
MNVVTKGYVALVAALLIGVIIGYMASTTRRRGADLPGFAGAESFVDVKESRCRVCDSSWDHCKCPANNPADRSQCPQIDWSKYVLKASIPPCPPQPDMTRYMLKSECPAPPDMSKYILKSAVPPCPPCIATCNKPCKIGECPPCPVQRCPVVTCPPPTTCPPCAAVEPPRCPEPQVSCKAKYEPEEPWMVRPLLSSISNM